MAKKETTKNEVATVEAAQLPSKKLAPSAEMLERINEVKDNLIAVEEFKLPRIKVTSGGAVISEDDEPVGAIEGVILYAKKTNVYYAKPYNPNDITPPDCYSLNGVTPETDMKNRDGTPRPPVHATCKGCPMSEFGTNSMKSGKACRNLKPMFVLVGDDSIMPRQLTISPTSIKAANAYFLDLTAGGYNYRKVQTRIEFFKENSKDTYAKVKFKKIGVLDEQRKADVDELLQMWKPYLDKQNVDQNEADGGTVSDATKAKAEDVSGEF